MDLAKQCRGKKNHLLPELGIGIKETYAGIGIPVSRILVWYRTKKCQTVSA
jgi:hypothetical protein